MIAQATQAHQPNDLAAKKPVCAGMVSAVSNRPMIAKPMATLCNDLRSGSASVLSDIFLFAQQLWIMGVAANSVDSHKVAFAPKKTLAQELQMR
jgi:hypothetical protein